MQKLENDEPVLTASQKQLIEPLVSVKAFSNCSLNGLKSLIQLAIPTGMSRKFLYKWDENWDVWEKQVVFTPEGLILTRDYYANHDYSSSDTCCGVYFIRPEQKILVLTFKADGSVNQILPNSFVFSMSIEDSSINWNGQNLTLEN